MTNLEYRNAVYKILGKHPLEPTEKKETNDAIKKELKKQKQLKDKYLRQYKTEVLNKSKEN